MEFVEIGEGQRSRRSEASGAADADSAAQVATVADAMITIPKTLEVGASVADARLALADEHVHMLLLTGNGVLHGALVREDLTADLDPRSSALALATLDGRTSSPDRPLAEAAAMMDRSGARRLAVIDREGNLLGLLCLNRTRQRYCTETDVVARNGGRAGP